MDNQTAKQEVDNESEKETNEECRDKEKRIETRMIVAMKIKEDSELKEGQPEKSSKKVIKWIKEDKVEI